MEVLKHAGRCPIPVIRCDVMNVVSSYSVTIAVDGIFCDMLFVGCISRLRILAKLLQDIVR